VPWVQATVEEVSLKEELGSNALEGLVARGINREVNWAAVQGMTSWGLDEIALKKGHREFGVSVTARAAAGAVRVLAVGPERKKGPAKAFLARMPQRRKQASRPVCTDLYAGFLPAVKEVLGHAPGVAERSPVAKRYREGAAPLRQPELRRLKPEWPQEHSEAGKGARWPSRKNPADLEADARALRQRLFAYAPDLHRAYPYREQVTAIFAQELSTEEATQELKKWRRRVKARGLQCYDSFFTTPDHWLEEIPTYSLHRHTSGFVEGLNNKLKVLKRRGSGSFNLGHRFPRLFLELEGYRKVAPTVG
jgi:transposase